MEIMLLKSCLQELERSLKALTLHIEQSPDLFIATLPGTFQTGASAILVANGSISEIHYHESTRDGRFTPVCLGAIAVSQEGILSAMEVNQAKANFHQACKTVMDNARSKGHGKLTPTGKAKRLRKILTEAGYPRLSMRQCIRQLPVLQHAPVNIRFSYSTGGRSIKKITFEQAKAFLSERNYDSDKAQIQYKKFLKLPVDTPLALVQDLPGYYKANVWHEPKSDPQTIPAFLPIFYPYDASQDVKRQDCLPDAHYRVKAGSPRADKKLMDDPVVDGVRIFGYKDA